MARSRKLRASRPSIDALEPLNSVSSLMNCVLPMTALSLAPGWSEVDQADREEWHTEDHPTVGLSLPLAPLVLEASNFETAEVYNIRGEAPASDTPEAPNSEPARSHSDQGEGLTDLLDPLTISLLPPRSEDQAPPTPSATFGAGTDAADSGPVAPPAPRPAPAASPAAGAEDEGIRPMTLAPMATPEGSASTSAVSPCDLVRTPEMPPGCGCESGSGSEPGPGSGEGGNSYGESGSPNDQPVDHTGWRAFISGGTYVFDWEGTSTQVNGYHPDDPGPIPQVAQGARWTGYPLLGTPNSTGDSYQIESYTWTFPAGVVKGYGRFAEDQERPGSNDPGSYWVFTGAPTGQTGLGNAVAMADHEPEYSRLAFTDDDLNYESEFPTNPNHEVNDHVIDSFYWGPEAEGILTVKLKATFVKFEDGAVVDRFEGEDSVTFDVVRPSGNIVVDHFGKAGVSSRPLKEGQYYLQLDKDHPRDPTILAQMPDPPLGLRWHSTVSIDAPFSGSFIHTQTMNRWLARAYTHKGVTNVQTGDVFLDNQGNPIRDRLGNLVTAGTVSVVDSMRYTGRVDDPNVPPLAVKPNVEYAPVGHSLYSNDSPGSPLTIHEGVLEWYTRNDLFTITVMYNPDSTGPTRDRTDDPLAGEPLSIWIPVGELTWKWGGQAVFNNGGWSKGWEPYQSQGTYKPSTTFPTWDRTIKDLESFQNWFTVSLGPPVQTKEAPESVSLASRAGA